MAVCRFSFSVRMTSPAPTISRPSIAPTRVTPRSGFGVGSATRLCSHSGHGLPGRSAVAACPTSHHARSAAWLCGLICSMSTPTP